MKSGVGREFEAGRPRVPSIVIATKVVCLFPTSLTRGAPAWALPCSHPSIGTSEIEAPFYFLCHPMYHRWSCDAVYRNASLACVWWLQLVRL